MSKAEWDKDREKFRFTVARNLATKGLTLEELSRVTPQLIRERILEKVKG